MAQEHPPHLAHHFDTPAQQFESGKLGMWLFLATEILLFGGLFCAYAVYRANHPEVFAQAGEHLDRSLGAVNTIVLICSSLTMAWAVRCAQRSQQRGLIINLVLTLAFACGFLAIKGVEYEHKWKHKLLPGKHYQPYEEAPGETASADPDTSTIAPTTAEAPVEGEVRRELPRTNIPAAPEGPPGLSKSALAVDDHDHGAAESRNVRTFFSIYFAMTGLHGVHVLVGMGVIIWLLIRSIKGHFNREYFTPVDLGGLYWHLVDLIWIFLFPLLYLIH